MHVFRVLSAIGQHFQLPTGQINTNIRHCVEVWLTRAIAPLSLGLLVHSFCRAPAKQPSSLPLHIHNGQLHSSASHRPVAHERGAGHDLQHQNHPPPRSEQCGSLCALSEERGSASQHRERGMRCLLSWTLPSHPHQC